MKYCVTFDRIISAIINSEDIDIDNKTVSFYNADPIIKGFAKIYSDIVDMEDRTKVLEDYDCNIARVTRKICQYAGGAIGYEWNDEINSPDWYTTIIYNLLAMGIAPTADLFNIMNNTGHGLFLEYSFSASEDAILTMATKNPNYFKTVNDDFFENYVAFKNLMYAKELNAALNINLPTTLTEWLNKYEWSPADCKFIFYHFKDFTHMYAREVRDDE